MTAPSITIGDVTIAFDPITAYHEPWRLILALSVAAVVLGRSIGLYGWTATFLPWRIRPQNSVRPAGVPAQRERRYADDRERGR